MVIYDVEKLIADESSVKISSRRPCCIITDGSLHLKDIHQSQGSKWKHFPRSDIVEVASEGIQDFKQLRISLADGRDEIVNIDRKYFDDVYFNLKRRL